jgi:hypothetical protein
MKLPGRASSLIGLIAAGALGAAACTVEQGPTDRSAPPAQTAAASPPASQVPASGAVPFTLPPPAYKGPLPPIPTSPYPLQRPLDVVQAVYTFAARHPEVLHYVPCFCGCQHSGHNNNDDCFISGREPNGRPIWDAHGMT